jgi:hypothetical protein
MVQTLSGLVEEIGSAVAGDSRHEPRDFPPLYESVDPEALGSVIDTLDSGEVSFEYADHVVTVRSDGDVRASPVGPTRAPATDD